MACVGGGEEQQRHSWGDGARSEGCVMWLALGRAANARKLCMAHSKLQPTLGSFNRLDFEINSYNNICTICNNIRACVNIQRTRVLALRVLRQYLVDMASRRTSITQGNEFIAEKCNCDFEFLDIPVYRKSHRRCSAPPPNMVCGQ
jgi:hypothetical protein